MMYLLLKWMHILSAIILFGTGFGSAFYKFMADRSGELAVIARTNRTVVLADWIFTTPTVILQPLSGIALLFLAGHDLSATWVRYSIALFILAGLCWLPVVVLQYRMRNLAETALRNGGALPAVYQTLAARWTWLGVVAFSAMIAVVGLMVFKPQ